MNQKDILLELIKYFLTTENVCSKDVLRRELCCFNDTYKKYFSIAWSTLEKLTIIVDDKLNNKFKNAYNLEANQIEFILESTINIIKKYSVEEPKCTKILDAYKEDSDEEDDYFKSLENSINIYIEQIKNSILDLLNRKINQNERFIINKDYESSLSPLTYHRHKNTNEVFKIVLINLLKKDDDLKEDEKLTITDEEIIQITNNYVNYESTNYRRTQINMKNDIIKALKLSNIIKQDSTKSPYEVNPFVNKEWRLNATTKATTIENVIEKIIKLKSLSPRQSLIIREIFYN